MVDLPLDEVRDVFFSGEKLRENFFQVRFHGPETEASSALHVFVVGFVDRGVFGLAC